MTKVSVIICTCDRDRSVVRAIRSVLRSSRQDFELVVIDQSSSTSTKDLIESSFPGEPRLRYARARGKGASRGRNEGVLRASGELLLFTDDDVEVHPDWIAEHVEFREQLREKGIAVGVVGGVTQARYEGGAPGWWPEEFRYVLAEFGCEPGRDQLEGGEAPLGANYSCSRELLLRAGGFDTRLGVTVGRPAALTLLGEDSALARKLAREGYRCMFRPTARVDHWTANDRISGRHFVTRLFQQGATEVLLDLTLREHSLGSISSILARKSLRAIRAFARLTAGSWARAGSWNDQARWKDLGHLTLGVGAVWGLALWPFFRMGAGGSGIRRQGPAETGQTAEER